MFCCQSGKFSNSSMRYTNITSSRGGYCRRKYRRDTEDKGSLGWKQC